MPSHRFTSRSVMLLLFALISLRVWAAEGQEPAVFKAVELSTGRQLAQSESSTTTRELQATAALTARSPKPARPPPPPPPPPPSPPAPSAPPPAPPAVYWELLNFSSLIVSVSMVNLPGTRKYVMISGRNGINGGTIDLDLRRPSIFSPVFNHFCGGVGITSDGLAVMAGGHPAQTKTMISGLDVLSYYNATTNNVVLQTKMVYPRWYATVLRLPDGKMLVVGGTMTALIGTPAPNAELWDPANPVRTVTVTQPPTFVKCTGYNWYPFMQLLPRGEILWWGDTCGSITDARFNVIMDLPPLPQALLALKVRTMYKTTASFAALPLKPDANGEYTRFGFVFFGGSFFRALPTTLASNMSARIDFWYCNDTSSGICTDGWKIEDMLGISRVMGDATVLPNGRILVHGGASNGYASLASPKTGPVAYNAVARSLVYDPDAVMPYRYTATDPIIVGRMYHSATCLDVSGKVLSAGCEACGVPTPPELSPNPLANKDLELRLTMGTPFEIAAPVVRPRITSAPPTITRGTTFTVSYSYGGTITGASLVAPCACTHSMNMNQNVVLLAIVSNDPAAGILTLQAPPAAYPAIATAGHYILFLLGDRPMVTAGQTYSEGAWLRLTDS